MCRGRKMRSEGSSISIKAIERVFSEKVSSKIRLAAEGVDRFRVFTPFRFEDGDHLVIVMKKEQARWIFSDEAHTYMHLAYDIDEKDHLRRARHTIIANYLSTFQIEDRNGELVLHIPEDGYGDAFYSFVQGLLKISEVSYLAETVLESHLDPRDNHPLSG